MDSVPLQPERKIKNYVSSNLRRKEAVRRINRDVA
jgi:hypothetical protein